MTHPSPARAFTLIEIMLAIVLSVLLFAAMLTFYRHAATVRQDVTEEIQRVNSRRLVMDRMTQDIRAAFPLMTAGMGMDGTTNRIKFLLTAVPPDIVWSEVRLTDVKPITPQQDLRLVSYGLQQWDNEGTSEIAGIEKTSQKLISAAVVQERQQQQAQAETQAGTPPSTANSEDDSMFEVPNVALLSPYYRFIRFRYFDGTEWKDTWSPGELPRAIEISLGEQALPEGMEPIDYPFDAAKRVIAISSARRQKIETNVESGLGDGLFQ